MIPNNTFNRGMHCHQRSLFSAFDRKVKENTRRPQMFMTEWHRRCRKTTAAINLNIRECCRTPQSKYVYIAPTYVMARNIVWDDPNMLKSYLPNKKEFDYKLNEQKMLVTFENGSLLHIGGADKPDSLRGIDAIGATFDEWALIKENTWTEIFRPIIAGPIPNHLDGYEVFRWALFLYTPKGMNHATQMFNDACCLSSGGVLPDCGQAPVLKDNWYASRVDGEKSGIFRNDELERMKEEMPQAFYAQEIKCSRITTEEMTLITSEMLHELNRYHLETKTVAQHTKKIVSIDPAWGGDVCKMMGMVNYKVEKEKSLREKHRTNEIVMAGKDLARQIGTKNFIIDCVNDVGIADGLEADEAGYRVQRFKSSHKATEKDDTQQAIRFANKRAEAYYYASKLIGSYEAGPINSAELLRQLPIASRYTTQGSSGRLIILPKMKIKETLGCSPDEADCYIMGCWGMQNVAEETEDSSRTARHLIPSHIGG